MVRGVYENVLTGELTFVHKPGETVLVGETDGELSDWLKWHAEQIKLAEEPAPVESPKEL